MRAQYLAELKQLLRLAAPLAAIQAGNQLMGMVDTAVVGRLGGAPLAAVGLAHALFFSISVLGMGVMMGLDPLISQALGARDFARARHLLWQGAWLSSLITAGLTLPILAAPALLVPIGIEPEVAALATSYLSIRFLGLLPMLLFVGVRAYLQAIGLPRPMVVSMLVANLFNLGADVLLVFGGEGLPAWTGPLRAIPAMGVQGAAIATVLCTVLQLAIVAVAVGKIEAPGFAPGMRRFDGAAVKHAFGVGLPIGLQMGAEVGVFALVGLLAGRLGTSNLAAHQIAITLASFSFCIAVGAGSAASVRVGRAVGSGDTLGARRAGLTAVFGGGAFMALAGLVFLAAPKLLAGLLTDDPQVIESAAPLLLVAAVFQVSDGVQAVGAGALRGAGDTRFPFLANLAGHYAVGLPIAMVLGLWSGLGIDGLWWGLCAGLTAVAIALVARFVRLSARPIRPLAAARAEAPASPLVS